MNQTAIVFARLSAVFLLLCGVLNGAEPQSLPVIKPPTFVGAVKELALPATVTDVRVGGSGRYVVLEIKSLRKLAILDVSAAQIVGYIPIADESTAFAAGATKLLTISTSNRTASRWDLGTQKKELTREIELESAVKHVLLGSASDGPAILGLGRRLTDRYIGNDRPRLLTTGAYMLDVNTLEPEKLEFGHLMHRYCRFANARVSANGTTATFGGMLSIRNMYRFVQVKGEWSFRELKAHIGFFFPSPDGRIIHTWAGPLSSKLQTLSGEPGEEFEYDSSESTSVRRIPSIHGPFVVSVSGGIKDWRDNQPERVSLSLEGEMRALATIPNLLPVFAKRGDRDAEDEFTLDKKLISIPKAKLVIQIAGDRSKVRLVKFDHESALKGSDVDFVTVCSSPPLSVMAGDRLSYQVQVFSNVDNLVYALESGPRGMQISESGLLTWSTSAESPYSNDVIISVTAESNQQTFQAFRLFVNDSSTPGMANAAREKPASPVAPVKTSPTSIGVKPRDIILPATITRLVLGGGGRYLLAHLQSRKQIAVIDVSSGKIMKFLPANDDKTLVAAGATRAFVFNLSQGVVSRYRLDTLERELTIQIPFSDAVQSAVMGADSEGPMILRTSEGVSGNDKCSLHFLDTNAMEPLAVNWPSGQPDLAYRDENRIQASSNGRVFSVSDVGILQLNGNEVSYVNEYSSSGEAMVPSSSGERFVANREIYDLAMHPVGKLQDKVSDCATSVTGKYFISFTSVKETEGLSSRSSRRSLVKQSGKLYRFGVDEPIATIQNLFSPVRLGQSLHDQVFLIPEAKVIAVRATTNDRVTLVPYDFDRALEESATDYLLVDSRAPKEAELGKVYTYDLAVTSKLGGIKFKLDAAPKGMTISSKGKVTWRVPRDLKERSHDVIVSVSDSTGQFSYHTFRIEVK